MGQREQITEQTRRWARHQGSGEVGTTSSFANMEALLKREYYGRFVIELIQNARDAWYANGRPRQERSVVRVLLHGDPPVLVVCNQGVALDSEGLTKYIAQFGESSKQAGAGIGHKGIGFKSVLEMTRCPEILSRTSADGPFELRVRFDPRDTERLIDELSPRSWEELVQACDPKGTKDKNLRLPVLRFPHWLDTPPPAVHFEAATDDIAFNTLIRLPYDEYFDRRLELTQATWMDRARQALDGVTDEIVMLLDGFEHVLLEDLTRGTRCNISMDSQEVRRLDRGITVRLVELRRNDVPSSAWLLYERSVAELSRAALDGEIVVGVRLQRQGDSWRPILPREQGRCFHLFFPTRIESKLPLLLHAYFEVDAGRTRFAPDAEERNRALLDALADLVVEAMADLVSAEDVDATALASLFGQTAGVPEDPQARAFRETLLERLDREKWIPVQGGMSWAAPTQVLMSERAELDTHLPIAFPPDYLLEKTNLFHPTEMLRDDPAARSFLAERAHRGLLGDGGVLGELVRPGETRSIWHPESSHADPGFCSLMAVFADAAANHPEDFAEIATSVRGDQSATILPAVGSGAEGGQLRRRLLCPPSTERGVGASVFARISAAGTRKGEPSTGAVDAHSWAPSAELGVPECLEMAFLPPDTLTAELLAGPAAALGIKPFGTDAVLDQLPVLRWSQYDAPLVARFVWRLLLRESVSRYGIKAAMNARQEFEPGKWFWCEPSFVRDTDRRRELSRRQALAHVPLPARGGQWRPAGLLCFGSDWAQPLSPEPQDRLVKQAHQARREAYADLEVMAKGRHESLVAPPTALSAALPLVAEDLHWLRDDILASLRLSGEPRTAADLAPEELHLLHQELMHVFLLTLGVWEIPPVEAVVNDLRAEATRVDPWDGEEIPEREAWRKELEDQRRTWFNVSYLHGQVRIAADYRLAWPLSMGDDSRVPAQARALSRGESVYRRLLHAPLLCHKCSQHKYRHWSRQDGPPNSFLHWQLSGAPWVPVTVDAKPVSPREPSKTWWMADPPDDATRIAVNPRRFLPLVRRGIGAELLKALGGHALDEATPEEYRALLLELRRRFETDALYVSVDSGAGRQAFVGLHRLVYTRLARTAESAQAQAILDDVGVLSLNGARLEYQPREKVLFNDGKHSVFKRHFVGKVPFVPLNIGEEDIARALGLRFFEAQCTMNPVESRESHTEIVSDFIDERLADIMALLTHVALGGRPLELGSDQFRIRSQRLRELEVYCVPDVVLELSVSVPDQAPISVTIGHGPNHDIHLDWQPHRAPVLYHDFHDPNWFEQLRRRLGAVVARLTENSAFQDTFALYFQVDEDGRETFLAERGVTAANLDEVRKALGRAGVMAQEMTRNWWKAVLSSASAPHDDLSDDDLSDIQAHGIQERLAAANWGDEHARRVVAESGGGDDVRANVRPGGPLDVLEQHGMALKDLDRRLKELGDPGLRVDVADKLLRRWRAEHGGKITFVLVRRDVDLEAAKKRIRSWNAPHALRYRVRVAPADVLEDVAIALQNVGITLTTEQLASDRVDALLAQSVDVSLDEWERSWRQVFDPEERRRLLRQRARAWHEAAEVPVVCLITSPGELPHRLRAARDEYCARVRGELAAPPEVRAGVYELLQERSLLPEAQGLLALMPDGDDLSLPDAQALKKALPTRLAAHVAEVESALRRQGRERLDALRRNIEELEKRRITPQPFAGPHKQQPSPARQEGATRKTVRIGKVGKRDLHDIGARGEAWALAAVVRPLEQLLANKPEEFDAVIAALQNLLCHYWDGEAARAVSARGEKALDRSLSHEDRIDGLTQFLHVSQVSDGFGCDLLGWLPPHEGEPPRPLALEVKSSAKKSFLASANEWREAERLKQDFAFLVVLRKGQSIRGMDLLPNPRTLDLGVEPDTLKFVY